MFGILSKSYKDSKAWPARVIATEGGGVPIPSSYPPCQIIERLYISNMLTAALYLKGIAPAYYKDAPAITHVLSIISGRSWQLEVIQKTAESEIIQKKIFISDAPDANLLEHFPEICSFIHSAMAMPDAQILVHCYAGVSRSASAIAAYLIWARHISHIEAIDLLRFRRPIVNPNTGFHDQLEAWYEMDCDLLDETDLPKEKYTMICKTLRVAKKQPNGKALRRFERPAEQELSFLKRPFAWATTRPR